MLDLSPVAEEARHRDMHQRIQGMKLNYYPDIDSLYINFSATPSTRSHEVSEGIVLDYDEEGRLTGIDIDNASHKIDLKEVSMRRVPAEIKTLVA